jgi:hypothetical protein
MISVMEPTIEPVAAAAPSAPQAPIDAAYCGPEPDDAEIAALFAGGIGFTL